MTPQFSHPYNAIGFTIDCTKNYKYLGITMENSGNFTEARKQLFQTAIKTMQRF
jgi:hypothetical protein